MKMKRSFTYLILLALFATILAACGDEPTPAPTNPTSGTNTGTTSAATTELIQSQLTGFLRNHMRVNATIEHRWAASVGYTVDGLPIIKEVMPNKMKYY